MSDRKLMRSIMRVVHPDLFGQHPAERTVNTESLQMLGNAVERFHNGDPFRACLRFFVHTGQPHETASKFKEINVTVVDSLAPLFLAFGLITSAEAAKWPRVGAGAASSSTQDVTLSEWLKSRIQTATAASKDLNALKASVKAITASLTAKYKLASLEYGTLNTQARNPVEFKRHVDALTAFESGLRLAPNPAAFAGLRFRIFHPEMAPAKTYAWSDGVTGEPHSHVTTTWTHVDEGGEVQMVACKDTVALLLANVDVRKARMLTAVRNHWLGREKVLARAVAESLKVRAVWRDSAQQALGSERFCTWAGMMLSSSQLFEQLTYSGLECSVVLHNDRSAPLAELLPACNVLQVRSDCPPDHLVQQLLDLADVFDAEASARGREKQDQENELLLAARNALGAKHVIRVCSQDRMPAVTAALKRLVQHAPDLRAMVDFSNVSLAIDDHYHVWESGFISIPTNFEVGSIGKRLLTLTGLPSGAPPEAPPCDPVPVASAAPEPVAALVEAPAQESYLEQPVAAGAVAFNNALSADALFGKAPQLGDTAAWPARSRKPSPDDGAVGGAGGEGAGASVGAGKTASAVTAALKLAVERCREARAARTAQEPALVAAMKAAPAEAPAPGAAAAAEPLAVAPGLKVLAAKVKGSTSQRAQKTLQRLDSMLQRSKRLQALLEDSAEDAPAAAPKHPAAADAPKPSPAAIPERVAGKAPPPAAPRPLLPSRPLAAPQKALIPAPAPLPAFAAATTHAGLPAAALRGLLYNKWTLSLVYSALGASVGTPPSSGSIIPFASDARRSGRPQSARKLLLGPLDDVQGAARTLPGLPGDSSDSESSGSGAASQDKTRLEQSLNSMILSRSAAVAVGNDDAAAPGEELQLALGGRVMDAAAQHCLDVHAHSGGMFAGPGACFTVRRAQLATALHAPVPRACVQTPGFLCPQLPRQKRMVLVRVRAPGHVHAFPLAL